MIDAEDRGVVAREAVSELSLLRVNDCGGVDGSGLRIVLVDFDRGAGAGEAMGFVDVEDVDFQIELGLVDAIRGDYLEFRKRCPSFGLEDLRGWEWRRRKIAGCRCC